MNAIERAIQENRLRFYPNGSYSYVPSREYLEKFQPVRFSEKLILDTKGIREGVQKLDKIIFL